MNFNAANLTNTCLFDAIVSDADKETAVLNGAMFSLEHFQALKRLLSQHPCVNIPSPANKTAVCLNNMPAIGLIESVEGEPMLPMDLYNDYTDDEIVFGTHPGEEMR